MRSLLCLVACALCAYPTPAQEKKADKKAEMMTLRVQLYRGTVIIGSPKIDKLPIKTRYGVLEVPLAEVQSIQVGLHYEKGQKEAIQAALKGLSSGVYKEREAASKVLLDNGRHSLPFLLSLSDADGAVAAKSATTPALAAAKPVTADLEAKKRAVVAKEKIDQKYPEKTPFYDVVRTAEFEIKGEIQWEALEIVSYELGTLKVKIASVKHIVLSYKDGGIFTVQANGKWVDTGLYLSEDSKLTVTASGNVDLYPQQGGYIANPNGINNGNVVQGKGGRWSAGLLIAKIGDSEFKLGSNYSALPGKAGSLHILVVDNPWGVQSQGHYDVMVRLE